MSYPVKVSGEDIPLGRNRVDSPHHDWVIREGMIESSQRKQGLTCWTNNNESHACMALKCIWKAPEDISYKGGILWTHSLFPSTPPYQELGSHPNFHPAFQPPGPCSLLTLCPGLKPGYTSASFFQSSYFPWECSWNSCTSRYDFGPLFTTVCGSSKPWETQRIR